jgi:hypothetical protein
MTVADQRMASRLRISGALIIAGLAVEAVSLTRNHPLAFLSFMFIGGAFLVAGIATYLFSIVSLSATSSHTDGH